MRLLLVEDSARLAELLCDAIRRAGYSLDMAASVAQLFASVAAVAYDLVIIDLGLPDGDGLDALRTLRQKGVSCPVLIVTARDRIEDRILGLDSGADDYLTKPFNNGELLARIRALLRRPAAIAGPVLRVGPLQLDERTGEVWMGDEPIELRAGEKRLLSLLMRRPDAIVAKPLIEESLSEFGRETSSNAVQILVSRLRKAIGGQGSGLRIETIHGVGYALRTDAE